MDASSLFDEVLWIMVKFDLEYNTVQFYSKTINNTLMYSLNELDWII